jgi:hypothetical protein
MAPKLSPSQLAALDKMIAAFEVGPVSFNIGGPVGINIGYRPVDFWEDLFAAADTGSYLEVAIEVAAVALIGLPIEERQALGGLDAKFDAATLRRPLTAKDLIAVREHQRKMA